MFDFERASNTFSLTVIDFLLRFSFLIDFWDFRVIPDLNAVLKLLTSSSELLMVLDDLFFDFELTVLFELSLRGFNVTFLVKNCVFFTLIGIGI